MKWLVPRLETFFEAHADVNLNLVSRNAPFDFSAEPFDAAIHYGEASWSGAVCAHLMDEDMLPVCSAQYQAQLGLHEPAGLAGAVLLQQFTRPSAWRDWFAHMGIEPANAFQGPRFDSFLMILEATQAHLARRCCRVSWWPTTWPGAAWCNCLRRPCRVPAAITWSAPKPSRTRGRCRRFAAGSWPGLPVIRFSI